MNIFFFTVLADSKILRNFTVMDIAIIVHDTKAHRHIPALWGVAGGDAHTLSTAAAHFLPGECNLRKNPPSDLKIIFIDQRSSYIAFSHVFRTK